MRRAARTWPALPAVFVLALAIAGAWAAGAPAVQAQGWVLDVDKAMDVAGVAPGMVVGEAGAGDGYFTLPMGRRVGPSGAVYANDIDRRSLRRLEDGARREGLANIHTVEGSVDDPLFPRTDLALVVVVHAFHDFGQPVEWLVNLKKYLRADGRVAIIDRDPDQGAPSHFWTRDRITSLASRAGYDTVRVVDEIDRHLIIVLRPRPGTSVAER